MQSVALPECVWPHRHIKLVGKHRTDHLPGKHGCGPTQNRFNQPVEAQHLKRHALMHYAV